MISSAITRASAGFLLVGGLALLFAPDALVPLLAPGVPPSATWIGSLLGAAWLGMAALNWGHRTTLLGGIYGRPVVYPNFVLYLVSALALVRVVRTPGAPLATWFLAVPVLLLAVAYSALLLRGPFDPLDRA